MIKYRTSIGHKRVLVRRDLQGILILFTESNQLSRQVHWLSRREFILIKENYGFAIDIRVRVVMQVKVIDSHRSVHIQGALKSIW